MAHGRLGTLGALAFGWWQQWGWGAHTDAKIVVLFAAGHIVQIEQLTGFLDLSAWQFIFLSRQCQQSVIFL